MNYLPDTEICVLLQSGEFILRNRGLEELLYKYQSELRNFLTYLVKNYSPNENALVDEVEANVYCELTNFADKRFEYRGEGSLGAWLKGVAKNLLLNILKSPPRKRELITPLDDLNLPKHIAEEVEKSTDVTLNRKFFLETFWKIVEDLDDKHKPVVILCYKEGYSHREIALELSISIPTSRQRLRRAMNIIRRRMAEEGFEDRKDYAIFPFWWIARRGTQEVAHKNLYKSSIDATKETNLGELIRNEREKRSLTRHELSQETDLGSDLISALENGIVIKSDIEPVWLDSIASTLNINPGRLHSKLNGSPSTTTSFAKPSEEKQEEPKREKGATQAKRIRFLLVISLLGALVYTLRSDILVYADNLLEDVDIREQVDEVTAYFRSIVPSKLMDVGESDNEFTDDFGRGISELTAQSTPETANDKIYCTATGGNSHLRNIETGEKNDRDIAEDGTVYQIFSIREVYANDISGYFYEVTEKGGNERYLIGTSRCIKDGDEKVPAGSPIPAVPPTTLPPTQNPSPIETPLVEELVSPQEDSESSESVPAYSPPQISNISLNVGASSCEGIVENNWIIGFDSIIRFEWSTSNPEAASGYRYQILLYNKYTGDNINGQPMYSESPNNIFDSPLVFESNIVNPRADVSLTFFHEPTIMSQLSSRDIYMIVVYPISKDGAILPASYGDVLVFGPPIEDNVVCPSFGEQ